MVDRPDVPPLVAALGGRRGIVDGAVPPVVFVAANAAAGLLGAGDPLAWAVATSLVVSGGAIALRRWRRQPVGGALRGLAGVAVALVFALVTGQARDFFLPGIVVDAAYGVVFGLSAVVGRPLVGHVHAAVFRLGRHWRDHPGVRRTYAVLTLVWAAVFGVRALVQLRLYLLDRPELLGLAKVALGWPLSAAALVVTLAAARRAGAHALPGPGV